MELATLAGFAVKANATTVLFDDVPIPHQMLTSTSSGWKC